MNPDTLVQTLQRGFRVTLGATASLIEILQDPQRRDENLSKLTQDFSELSEEWAMKGEVTEQEARNFVENLVSTPPKPDSYGSPTVYEPPSSGSVPTAGVQTEIRELTQQLASIRLELEKLREQDGSDS